jgi:hypothetical protein
LCSHRKGGLFEELSMRNRNSWFLCFFYLKEMIEDFLNLGQRCHHRSFVKTSTR